MKEGDTIILGNIALLKPEIRGKRAEIIDATNKGFIRAKMIEGDLKGLVVWLPHNFYSINRKEVVIFS